MLRTPRPCKPKFPSNKLIVESLIVKFTPFITGMSFKLGVKYSLSPEDREDLIAHARFKISKVAWRKKLIADMHWIQTHVNRPNGKYVIDDVLKILNGYAHSLLQNSMRDEVRRIKCRGLAGLGVHKLHELPYHEDIVQGQPDQELFPYEEPSIDGTENRAIAREIALRAKAVLDAEEWLMVSLVFGFDGGGERTPVQAAREAELPRKRAAEIFAAAMKKLRDELDAEP